MGGVYINLTNDNQSLYILMSNTGTNFTKFIGKYTKAPYNHVSLCLDKDLEYIYSFGRRFPSNPLLGGFVREYKDKGTFARFKDTECMIIEIPVSRKQYINVKKQLLTFIKWKFLFLYNPLFFTVAFKFPIKIPICFVCTHFVAHVLQVADIIYFGKRPEETTPNDFMTLTSNYEVIYEGYLREYQPQCDINNEFAV